MEQFNFIQDYIKLIADDINNNYNFKQETTNCYSGNNFDKIEKYLAKCTKTTEILIRSTQRNLFINRFGICVLEKVKNSDLC